MKKINENGSHIVAGLLIVVVIAVVGVVGWRVMNNEKSKSKSNTPVASNGSPQISGKIKWMYNGSDWQYTGGTPPSCASPFKFTNSPTDVSLATSILYPGQTRGGNYKPHGGFRFDGLANNKISVKAPIDAQAFEGSRYLVNGEIQYSFDFIAPCGIMYRVGHLLTLSPDFQKTADTFPAAQEGDSRTTFIDSQITIKSGTVIGTAVGISKGGVNTFFDFGVYDLRSQNAASQLTSYKQTQPDKMLAWHGVCWFNYLPTTDATRVNSLPASDSTSGKNSDYCTSSGDNITSSTNGQPSTTTTTGSGSGSGNGTGSGTGGGGSR